MGTIARIRNVLGSINRTIKKKKQEILNRCETFLEPSLWAELISPDNRGRHNSYIIRNDDLPNIRDLKSILNMLAAVEHMTESYEMVTLSVVSTLTLPEDFYHFYRNYAIFASTDSPLTDSIKNLLAETLSYIKEKFNFIWQLLTLENLQQLALLFKRGMISLERYEERFMADKRAAAAPKKEIEKPADKPEKKEGFFTNLVLKNEEYLRKIYKEDFDKQFYGEKKPDTSAVKTEKQPSPEPLQLEKIADPQTWQYYPENPKDTLTIKNIKKYSNGIIGIAKMLDNYHIYQKSGYTYGAYILTTGCVYELSNAYSNLRDFEFKAIIAEQGKPMTDYIKSQMGIINGMLEKLACLADKFESEGILKENVLLENVGKIADAFNQQAYELRAPIDYKVQKRYFYETRIKERESYLKNIDTQLSELKHILPYQGYLLSDIPQPIVQRMIRFIDDNKVDISMNRQNLAAYQVELKDTAVASPVWFRLFREPFQYLNYYLGRTPHSQFMTSIANRELYLKKHKKLLTERFKRTLDNAERNPYDFFKLTDLKKPDDKQEAPAKQVILEALKKHVKEITADKLVLYQNAVKKLETEEKNNTSTDSNSSPIKIDGVTDNHLTLVTKEEGRFLQAIDAMESPSKSNNSSAMSEIISTLRATDCLRPKSMHLLDEIIDILTLEKRTLGKLEETIPLPSVLNSQIAKYAMPIFLHEKVNKQKSENTKSETVEKQYSSVKMIR